LVVAGAAGFFFFLLGFFAGFAGVVAAVPAAGVSAAIGAADFGISADIAIAAKPKVNSAVLIRDPNLVMRSPNGGINKHFKEYASIRRFRPR
jgi:hypothetical protein